MKNMMTKTKALLSLAAVAAGLAAHALSLSVTDVKIAQRYPWNGLVDIDYKVVCDDPNADVWVYPVGYDADFNTSYAPRTFVEGSEGVDGNPVKAGTHRMTWNMAADMPANFNRAKFSMKMYAYSGAAPYMVIDLEGGPEAERYPVTYMSEIPDGEWSDEYKTTKLVLKLVVPGTFKMGSPVDELGHNWYSDYGNYETEHDVTITQPFYMGVFEVTQKQYALVTGSDPSDYKGDNRPVERVSYNNLRGETLGAQWPTYKQVDETSFFGKIRSRTGLTFDLPTEAQWEYTCRAGTTTALNNGKDLTSTGSCPNMAEVGRYYGNTGDGRGGYGQHTVVGKYRPNAWGFYDMHGNVAEWCRDWHMDNLGPTPARDPVGPERGSYRQVRGGCWQSYNAAGYAAACRSAYRSYNYGNTYSNRSTNPGNASTFWGFRVACFPAE